MIAPIPYVLPYPHSPCFPPSRREEGTKKRARFFEEGAKKPGVLFGKRGKPGRVQQKGKTRARSTKGENPGAFGKSQKPPLMPKALRGVSAQQTGGFGEVVQSKKEKKARVFFG